MLFLVIQYSTRMASRRFDWISFDDMSCPILQYAGTRTTYCIRRYAVMQKHGTVLDFVLQAWEVGKYIIDAWREKDLSLSHTCTL